MYILYIQLLRLLIVVTYNQYIKFPHLLRYFPVVMYIQLVMCLTLMYILWLLLVMVLLKRLKYNQCITLVIRYLVRQYIQSVKYPLVVLCLISTRYNQYIKCLILFIVLIVVMYILYIQSHQNPPCLPIFPSMFRLSEGCQ
jgi:hypothetical protein